VELFDQRWGGVLHLLACCLSLFSSLERSAFSWLHSGTAILHVLYDCFLGLQPGKSPQLDMVLMHDMMRAL
jgi:hypothetical protein